jgi:hypothetical protein
MSLVSLFVAGQPAMATHGDAAQVDTIDGQGLGTFNETLTDPTDTADWYCFQAVPGDNVTVTMTSTAIDSHLFLFYVPATPAVGDMRNTYTEIASNDDFSGLDSQISLLLGTAGYYVAAAESISAPGQTLGDYTLTVAGDVTGCGLTIGAVLRTTSTTLSCTPGSVKVGQTTTCTATVADIGSGTAVAPAGDVDLMVPPGIGVLSDATCTLAQIGTTASSDCWVDYTPSKKGTGTHSLDATFDATGIHAASNDPGGTTVTVDHRVTTTSVSCVPAAITIGGNSVCTTTVEDTDNAGAKSAPNGTAEASSDDIGGFAGNGCTLATPVAETKKCAATYTPTIVGDGTHNITSEYTHNGTADVHADSSDTTSADVAVAKATTNMLYIGDQIVAVGGAFTPKAHLTSAFSGCEPNKDVAFSLDRTPTTGAPGTYSLGTDATDSGGIAVLSPVNTTGWQPGIYDITATFTEDGDCKGSADTTLLTVAGPGTNAYGGGWYKLPTTSTTGSPKVNFGFVIQKAKDGTTTGQMLIHNNTKWRLKGIVTQYGQLSSSEGAASGTGTLYRWDTGTSTWMSCDTGVTYTANFKDAGTGTGKKKGQTTVGLDQFGVQMKPLLKACSTNLPNSKPQDLKGGDLRLAPLPA